MQKDNLGLDLEVSGECDPVYDCLEDMRAESFVSWCHGFRFMVNDSKGIRLMTW